MQNRKVRENQNSWSYNYPQATLKKTTKNYHLSLPSTIPSPKAHAPPWYRSPLKSLNFPFQPTPEYRAPRPTSTNLSGQTPLARPNSTAVQSEGKSSSRLNFSCNAQRWEMSGSIPCEPIPCVGCTPCTSLSITPSLGTSVTGSCKRAVWAFLGIFILVKEWIIVYNPILLDFRISLSDMKHCPHLSISPETRSQVHSHTDLLQCIFKLFFRHKTDLANHTLQYMVKVQYLEQAVYKTYFSLCVTYIHNI